MCRALFIFCRSCTGASTAVSVTKVRDFNHAFTQTIGIIPCITVVQLPGLFARLLSGQLITALATYNASNEGSQLSSVVDSAEGGPSVHEEERWDYGAV